MSNYVVSARKYRPKNFEEVVGQSHITTTLENAIKSEHLAQAMLFCGPRGVGKTTCARILARVINDFDASNEEVQGQAMNIFELDAASNNSVDDIRNLIEQVRYPPQVGKYKVYIIDEVHMLSKGAFNAFLKTLEEPPSYAIFILATTEKHKVIPTILSRCQIYDFNRIGVEEITAHLLGIAKQESIDAERDALHLIAQKSDGALRDALSLFDQLSAFSGGQKITYSETLKNLHILDFDYFLRLSDLMASESEQEAILLFDEILEKGFDGHQFISGLLQHFRDLLMLQATQTTHLVTVPENAKKHYDKQAQQIGKSLLLSWLSLTQQTEIQYKASQNKRLLIELCIIKMVHVKHVIGPEEIADLKKKTPLKTEPSPAEKKLEVKSEVHSKEEKKPEKQVKDVAVVSDGKDEEISEAIPAPTPSFKPRIQESTSNSESLNEKEPKPGIKMSTKPKLIISLNGKDEEEQKEEEPDFLALEQEIPVDQNVTQSNLEGVWEKFQEKYGASSTQVLKRVWVRKPKLEDLKVVVELQSPVEEKQIQGIKPELLFFLRKNLKNKKLELHTSLPDKSENKRPYTSQEKFDYLAEKNPDLLEFKRRLGLEIEF